MQIRAHKKENEGKVWCFDVDFVGSSGPVAAAFYEEFDQPYAERPAPRPARTTSVLDELADKKRRDEEALAAKREAARQRRHERDRMETGSVEMRIAPEDGRSYSLQEAST